MSRCGMCQLSVSRKQAVFCNGDCKNVFHHECVKLPGDLASYLSSVAGLQWSCVTCREDCARSSEKKLIKLFEGKCEELFSEVTVKFDKLKCDLLALTSYKVSEITQPNPKIPTNNQVTYAEKLSGTQKIIVKPKNVQQGNNQTKNDVMKYANPIDLNIKIANVKNVKNGGILLNCQSDNFNILKETAKKQLSDNYDIHVLKNTTPQLRIVGLADKMDDKSLQHYLKTQNNDLLSSSAECKIVKIWPTKKNPSVFQAQLQVDMSTFKNLLNRGRVLIGLNSCTVYEAFHIPRCFKCNSFFHTKNSCRSKVSCPVCSKEHEVKDCPENSPHACINCINLKNRDNNIDINVNHSVWDYTQCVAYKKALDKCKIDIFGPSNT